MEMEKTAIAATQMTEAGRGRHHIGDFLPPEELTKFMTKVCMFLRELLGVVLLLELLIF